MVKGHLRARFWNQRLAEPRRFGGSMRPGHHSNQYVTSIAGSSAGSTARFSSGSPAASEFVGELSAYRARISRAPRDAGTVVDRAGHVLALREIQTDHR